MLSKFAPKRKDLLISINEIKDELRLVEGTDDYYVSYKGDIYRKYTETEYYKLKKYVNKQAYNYVYVTLIVDGKHKSFRLHRLVAKAFIPNPDNLPAVDHIDCDKTNNCVENLQWVTNSQNSKKAVKDGRLVNAKGFEDSQSIPVVCFTPNKQVYKIYGSITEAHKELGVSKSTVKRQIVHISKKIRCGYYFRSLKEYKEKGFVL